MKNIVIKEMTRIVNKYRELMFKSSDMALIEAMNKKTDITQVINHIMNNLTAKRIYGGDDEICYEYIHEYYVDNFDKVEDKWSSYLRNTPAPSQPSVKTVAREEAKAKITPEMEQQFYEEALKQAQIKAEQKAEAKLKADEEKRKAKEKELAAKKKEEAQRAKEEALSKGAGLQMSLFDL